jgi:hypothetical protein
LLGALAVAPVATTSAQAAGAKTAAAGVGKVATVWLAVGKGFLLGLAIYGAATGVSEISTKLDARRTPTPTAQRAAAPARARVAPPGPPASALLLAPVSEDPKAAPRAAPRGSANASLSAPARLPSPAAVPPSVASFDDSEHDDSEQQRSARVSQLEAETRALRRARDELRAGKLVDAFATLEASRRQFSAPELYQEREALMIELLHRSGQVATAEQRAGAFLDRFPDSPHAQQIRRFAAH